ncbi:hypothetical protein IMG5_147700 [Ichthyophthirius multifiliis]|uniref:Translation factor GUF1 homolog, mitochondrial n=1 Tax=Ichthyophthirius multifiliis TaxID=5932 RepID=G0QY67_ICHMU|nr:hypothetical protein IMG5_147700 [Ichthyophthirius multifiliis]EGR29841.1 hypothetical protein IMG5_147700 [Ichthyophthirius multifiliis]|eukprot:XP_004031077.1 hypothetical protein IMG5_147700 [Ichthyophthirius multifiliis]
MFRQIQNKSVYLFTQLKPNYPIQNIRNFNIIAHIDHGKSTLADRILELTGSIKAGIQYLDKLKVEKERGITVKAQSASMEYTYNNTKYLLNLIDTPGHVDFHYEVSRSMRSCNGSLLLVDACQGIQAQTLSNYEKAKQNNLKIIPIINKIDMPAANPEDVSEQMQLLFEIEPEEIHYISAKTGKGVQNILDEIILKIPPPEADINKPFKSFIIDSWFSKDQGVIMLAQIKDGFISKGEYIQSCAFKKKYEIFEVCIYIYIQSLYIKVGVLNPEMTPKARLTAGEVGYIFANMKQVTDARVGDTFHKVDQVIEPEPGFQPVHSMVFAGLYPDDPDDYPNLQKSIHKLALTDPAVSIYKESSAALGPGFRCGFLGLLHMDVFKQRLDDEYGLGCFLTTPNVPYRAKLKGQDKIIEIENALMAPEEVNVEYYEEPIVEATIICPKEYIQEVLNFCSERRGIQKEIHLIDDKRQKIKFEFPLIILLMGEPVDTLSFMVHERRAQQFGKLICGKLKDKLPAQQFTLIIQAKVGSKIIAKEEISQMRKNVTAKCYGGDYSRKKKLLERQKEGKKNQDKLEMYKLIKIFLQIFLKIEQFFFFFFNVIYIYILVYVTSYFYNVIICLLLLQFISYYKKFNFFIQSLNYLFKKFSGLSSLTQFFLIFFFNFNKYFNFCFSHQNYLNLHLHF